MSIVFEKQKVAGIHLHIRLSFQGNFEPKNNNKNTTVPIKSILLLYGEPVKDCN